MRKADSSNNRVRLSEYLKLYEVNIHSLYEFFWDDIPCPPRIADSMLTQCCSRRPVILLHESAQKRLVIDNCLCYIHAIGGNGHRDLSIRVQEVKNLTDQDLFISVLLDALSSCPFLRPQPLFRAEIVQRAYEKRELFKTLIDVASLTAFGKMFNVAPATLTRNTKLEQVERARLGRGDLKKRGKANKKKAESTSTQPDHGRAGTETMIEGATIIKQTKVNRDQPSLF